MGSSLEDAARYFTRVQNMANDNGMNGGARLLWAMDQLNAKASGLLTHISLMIAVITVGLQSRELQENAPRAFALIGLWIYTCVALYCTRALWATSPALLANASDDGEEDLGRFLQVQLTRRRVYVRCLIANAILFLYFLALLLGIVLTGDLGAEIHALLEHAGRR